MSARDVVPVAVILALTLVSCGPEAGAVATLAIGDCFDEPTTTADLSQVPLVPCEEPHRYEVVGSVLVPDSAQPGADLEEAAVAACADSFASYVGVAPGESELRSAALAPTEAGWADGDREALCLVTDPGASLVGSVAGAGR